MFISEDELRKIWEAAGGSFHGPHVEHATMPTGKFFPFLRKLCEDATPKPRKRKPVRKSRMTPQALTAIANGSLPRGYTGPFSLETGQPVTLTGKK